MSSAAHRPVLASRYASCFFGDWATLVLLVGQAPVIGWLCTVVWRSVERDTPSLYFVMALSSVWFGCIGSCREIVKERAIIERERFFGVSPLAVVLSKAQVLFAVSVVQSLLLQFAVEWRLALRGPFLVQTAALCLASFCGVGMGLVLSAFARTQERAVAAVPLVLLPQVLFSETAVPREYFSDTVAIVEKLMPVRWAYRVFVDVAAADPPWLTVVGSLAALLGYAVALIMLAVAALLPRRES